MRNGDRFEGRDLADALRKAAAALGCEPGELDYEVVEEGRKGWLGLGGRPVRVRVSPRRVAAAPDAPSTERRPEAERARPDRAARTAPAEPASGAQVERGTAEERQGDPEVEKTLTRIFELTGLDLEIRPVAARDGVCLELDGRDRKLLLQRDAELLSSLQFLLNRMGRRAWPEAGRVQLNCRGYRNRRDEEIRELAREVALQVGRTGQAKRLRGMNPYERRLVHLTVREFPGVTSHSLGDGFLKTVVVERGEPGANE